VTGALSESIVAGERDCGCERANNKREKGTGTLREPVVGGKRDWGPEQANSSGRTGLDPE
jgi:hypothetical protein